MAVRTSAMPKTKPARAKNTRLVYLDTLRVLSVFAMIVLHITANQWAKIDVNTSEWGILNVYDSIVRFCVPVFVMISGTLFLSPEKEVTLHKLASKYMLRIITSFFFWSAFYAIVSMLFEYKTIQGSIVQEFFRRLFAGHYHLWFLRMITMLYLISPFLRKIVLQRSLAGYFLFLWGVFILAKTLMNVPGFEWIRELPIHDGIFSILGYSGYFVLGYYLSQTRFSRLQRMIIYLLGIACVWITIYLTSSLSRTQGVAVDAWYSYFMANCTMPSIAIFVWFKNHYKRKTVSREFSHIMTLLSKLAFGMYLLHEVFTIIFTNIFGWTAISFTPWLAVPTLAILNFVLSLLVSLVINATSRFKKYII